MSLLLLYGALHGYKHPKHFKPNTAISSYSVCYRTTKKEGFDIFMRVYYNSDDDDWIKRCLIKLL